MEIGSDLVRFGRTEISMGRIWSYRGFDSVDRVGSGRTEVSIRWIGSDLVVQRFRWGGFGRTEILMGLIWSSDFADKVGFGRTEVPIWRIGRIWSYRGVDCFDIQIKISLTLKLTSK